MLIKVIVENFKSFQNSAELTMISSSKIQKETDHKIKLGRVNILKHAAIYGANAAGKSNLIDFFSFFVDTVRDKLPIESTKWFCKCSKENIDKDSTFEIQFTIGKRIYAYGFTALLNQNKITSEWLYELFQARDAKCLFERNIGERKPKLGKEIELNDIEKSKFMTYVDDFDGNESILFLTEMNRNKKYSANSKLLFFKNVYDCLTNNLTVIKPETSLSNYQYYYDDTSLELINKLIKTFDTGIERVSIEKTTIDELKGTVPDYAFKLIVNRIQYHFANKDKRPLAFTMRVNDIFVSISFENDEPIISTLKLYHNNSFYDFNFYEESDGTRRIFDLMDMLLNKNEDVIYIVDELERSLHPKLTEHFLKLFMDIHSEHKSQLIFTTHESSIMDQKLFRRDEIWFVERDNSNTSTVYSLDKFKERYDKTLSKAYLEGRYGAIPVFSSFKIMED